MVNGDQLVLLPADNRLLAFRLGGEAPLPPPAVIEEPFPKPPLPRFSAELARRGRTLYDAHDCASCHYLETRATRPTPDLRRATAGTHRIWNEIVLEGLFVPKGMVNYGDPNSYPAKIGIDDVEAIRAFVINEAWKAYEANPGTLHGGQ